MGNHGGHALQGFRHWLIDPFALTDPFLARLPGIATNPQKPSPAILRAGHHRRWIPTDYGEFLLGRVETLPDERLRGLLRDVSLAARTPDLFTKKRFAAIWRLNTGHYADLELSRYRDAASKIRVVSEDTRSVVPLSRLTGAYKPDGHYWRALDTLEFYHNLYVTLGRPILATELQLSLGAREGYAIYVNGEWVATIERVGDYHGLRNHTLPLPGPVWARSVEIRALGRHWLNAIAVGHLYIR